MLSTCLSQSQGKLHIKIHKQAWKDTAPSSPAPAPSPPKSSAPASREFITSVILEEEGTRGQRCIRFSRIFHMFALGERDSAGNLFADWQLVSVSETVEMCHCFNSSSESSVSSPQWVYCEYTLLLMYLWTVCEAFTNIEIINQAKFAHWTFRQRTAYRNTKSFSDLLRCRGVVSSHC